jgi:RimJ/RimL family protein N-acetyltransferase
MQPPQPPVADPTIVDQGPGPPTLPVGAFRLRPLRPGDEVAWFDYLRTPGVIEHTSFPAVDLAATRGFVERALANNASNGPYRWALAESRDLLVGTCGFPSWSLDHGHAELGYDLNPEYQRLGLMAAAVDTVVGWAFSQPSFHRVHAFVMTSNQPSIALLERCGFEREGTLRAFRLARGVPRDCHLYARLKGATDR